MADLGKVIEDYQTVGVEYLAIPYLSEEYRPQGPRYAEVLAEMDRISEELQKSGLKLMYHNHDFEFAQLPAHQCRSLSRRMALSASTRPWFLAG